ncbi:hypothetical protein ACSVDA_13765 [Cytobacillus sp. Hm23]
MKNTKKTIAKRIYTDPKTGFNELISLIIHNKIDEIVNNANKVSTATSQNKPEGLDVL